LSLDLPKIIARVVLISSSGSCYVFLH
jgi:hypothetical protein